MGYWDNSDKVAEYIKMAEGFDGRELIEVLQTYKKKGSQVLEIGMGPGKDLTMLSEVYKVIGSDVSRVFLDLYKSKYRDADLILLNAVKMDTERRFDCIYSNKVLHHLSKDNLKLSFINQIKVLNKGGILFHSFWYGDKEEEFNGLRFIYYTEETIKSVLPNELEILEFRRFKEIDKGDSFLLVLRI